MTSAMAVDWWRWRKCVLPETCGATITWEADGDEWFAETQGTYLVALAEGLTWPDVEEEASALGIETKWIAVAEGDCIDGRVFRIPLADLRAAHEGFFPALMQGEL